MVFFVVACSLVLIVVAGMFIGGCLAMRQSTHSCSRRTCPPKRDTLK
jgi:hypothetical protein